MSYPSAPTPGQPQPNPQPNLPEYGQMATGENGVSQANAAQGYGNYQFNPDQRPKPGIIPLGPLSFGEIISGIVGAYRANPKGMLLTPLIVAAPIIGILAIILGIQTGISQASGVNDSKVIDQIFGAEFSDKAQLIESLKSLYVTIGASWFVYIATAFAGLFIIGMISVVVSQLAIGRVTTVSQAWAGFKSRFWAFFGYQILTYLIIYAVSLALALLWIIPVIFYAKSAVDNGGGEEIIVVVILTLIVFVLALVVANLFFMVKFVFGTYAVVLEGCGPAAAIKRSWSLTKGSFWRILGIVIVVQIVVGIVVSMLTNLISMPLAGLAISSSVGVAVSAAVILFALEALVTLLAMPITVAAECLLYLDVRMRKENLAPTLIQSAGFAPAVQPASASQI